MSRDTAKKWHFHGHRGRAGSDFLRGIYSPKGGRAGFGLTSLRLFAETPRTNDTLGDLGWHLCLVFTWDGRPGCSFLAGSTISAVRMVRNSCDTTWGKCWVAFIVVGRERVPPQIQTTQRVSHEGRYLSDNATPGQMSNFQVQAPKFLAACDNHCLLQKKPIGMRRPVRRWSGTKNVEAIWIQAKITCNFCMEVFSTGRIPLACAFLNSFTASQQWIIERHRAALELCRVNVPACFLLCALCVWWKTFTEGIRILHDAGFFGLHIAVIYCCGETRR